MDLSDTTRRHDTPPLVFDPRLSDGQSVSRTVDPWSDGLGGKRTCRTSHVFTRVAHPPVYRSSGVERTHAFLLLGLCGLVWVFGS